jgi:hypothetical protein
MSEHVGLRGKAWFQALTGKDKPQTGDPGSVLTANGEIGAEPAFSVRHAQSGESFPMCARWSGWLGRGIYLGDAGARSDRCGPRQSTNSEALNGCETCMPWISILVANAWRGALFPSRQPVQDVPFHRMATCS